MAEGGEGVFRRQIADEGRSATLRRVVAEAAVGEPVGVAELAGVLRAPCGLDVALRRDVRVGVRKQRPVDVLADQRRLREPGRGSDGERGGGKTGNGVSIHAPA